MKNLMRFLFVGFISLLSMVASAATIDGSLAMGGAYINVGGTDDLSGLDLSTTTAFTLDTVMATGASGDIIGTVDGSTPIGSGGSVVFGSGSVTDFFTVGPWSFDLLTLNNDDPTLTDYLSLSGTGLLYKDGEIGGHTANWSFTAQSLTSYSMTVTTTVVPVPAAVWLFGSGLLGLVGVARRKV